VVTLFHELGHGIHDMVSKTLCARFHGSVGTVVDFGEAPSQMLENWCWIPSQLKALSRHYSTLSEDYKKAWQEKMTLQGDSTEVPDPQISDEMLGQLLKARGVNQALAHLNQLSIAIFDFTVHDPTSHNAMEEMDISKTFNHLKREIWPIETPWDIGEGDDWGHQHSEYRSLVVGDYSAGYYAYTLYCTILFVSSLKTNLLILLSPRSSIYSADMFDTFFRSDPTNSAAGRRYRHELLEKGGSQPEMDTLLAYLGRQPSPVALYKEMGLE